VNLYHPAIYPVFLAPLVQVFPAGVWIVAAPPGVASAIAEVVPRRVAIAMVSVWLPPATEVLPEIVVAVAEAEAGPPVIAIAMVVVWLSLAVAALPEISAEPPETAVAIASGASNVCSFPSCSSSVEVPGGVFVDGSIDAPSNDSPDSHSSNPMVSIHKKMERFDNSPNLNHSFASDTIALPTDATTSHCRKRCPHLRQEQHRHSSQGSLPPPAVRRIR
jgi:hypothetical protein